MAYSSNDSAADSLAVTLETIDEAIEKAELGHETDAIEAAREEVERAREVVLQREAPTPTQQLVSALQEKSESNE